MVISRIAISLAALVTLAPVAAAQTSTTTTTTVETMRGPRLSPEQRTVIYRTVTRERRVTPPVNVRYRIGAPLPAEVELSAFPDDTYVDVPVLKRYRYVYMNDKVLVVDPETSEVVDIITD
jgi:hypothetical protein